ncbi:CO/xanthine dehydrogenase Mo-binding subunit [Palleronia aestuarii]|uniref:CO/xanthine dehydrogenase Mo-binding subunit n=1 Tax=Palleronia aestuarii TaxID=568105 RepID=A0A2W7NFS3_9RHOB|nr:molybdopterin cofactor-binding domain-containing protein [Palleronia aestuarii]PZX17027.1 CO/xanthine dehydrogenase Mo-binding subunit [Palleronia aestuarii]
MSLDAPPNRLTFRLNGAEVALDADPARRLSDVLREVAGARDVKVGCSAGDCGTCSVLVGGVALCACMVPAGRAAGAEVETAAGLVARDPLAHRLAVAFQARQAAQCGICTPGMMVSAMAYLRAGGTADPAAVEAALAGVLCRCTGYRKIVAAVSDVAADRAPDVPSEGSVGAPVPRVDGWPKVAGKELFGDDVAPADALLARAVRSPHHRARFAFGDLEGYRIAAGLDLVLTAADVPGENRFGVIPGFEDQPVMASREVRFRGEAVACLVGTRAALDAAPPPPVEWTPLPHALEPEDAGIGESLHADRAGNVMATGRVRRGDPETALAEAAYVVEGRFSTGFVEHAYIEPEAGFARRVGDRIEIGCCTQAPYMNRDGVARILGIAPEAVRIVPTATGGGFGSKLDLTTQPFVAIAAWKLGRPVRMCLTRIESIQSTTKRHPSRTHMRIGADADGRITGAIFDGVFNTGAYASWGPTVATRVPIHASGPYRTPAFLATSAGIHTNCAPAGAFRGFGVPQSAVAQESLYDLLAERLGMDRLAFRRLNCLRDGDPTVTGQVFETGMGIAACFDALEPHWTAALAAAEAANAVPGPVRRGVGIAAGWYGCGNTGLSNPSTIRAGITADGIVRLHQGATDIGQGSNTVIAQIFAQALGVPLAAVELVGPDTDLTPDAGKTSASRQTFITGNAARACGAALRTQILRLGNVSKVATIVLGPGSIALEEGGTRRRIDLTATGGSYAIEATGSYDPPTGPLDADGQGAPYAIFGTAAQMAELDVDTELGTVTLLKFRAAHDVGRAINPLLVEGQVEGGIAQGIGMALMEEFIPGRTENLHDYLIPTVGDVPPIDTIIVESGDPHGPFGAKGLGEHCLIPTAPAILNAIAHATGARIHDLPATPDRVRAAILAARE